MNNLSKVVTQLLPRVGFEHTTHVKRAIRCTTTYGGDDHKMRKQGGRREQVCREISP